MSVKLRHVFVENFPEELEEATLYISIKYATTTHKCCCGCGYQVVARLSPNGWLFTFNGEVISLYPSFGNWSFPCKSHYWIRDSEVVWARRWSDREIAALRNREQRTRDLFNNRRTKKDKTKRSEDTDFPKF